MPAGHTKHPEGRPPLDPQSLRAVWFEEGDGVAIFEDGELLAVIPGWSDMSKGMPGYSRDVIGQTPFGWSLDDAMEGLGPRVSEASDVLAVAAGPGRPGRSSSRRMLGHLLARLGPGAQLLGRQSAAGSRWSASPSGRRRRTPFLHRADHGRDELPADAGDRADRPEAPPAGRGSSSRSRRRCRAADAARIFLWLAQYPWREVTWLGSGQTHPLVPRARLRSRSAAETRPSCSSTTRPAARPRGPRPVGVHRRRRRRCAGCGSSRSPSGSGCSPESRGAASLVNQLASQSRSWVSG